MKLRHVVTLLALALAHPAAAKTSRCNGTLTGSVKAKFECTAVVVIQDGTSYLIINGVTAIDGVPAYAPGSFEIPAPVQAKTYTLAELGQGLASVAAEGGTLYTASKTTGQRGEVTVTLKSVKADPKVKGAYVVHGTYRARLIPAGAGKTGEVIVEVKY
jgi:hypothetical protein